jgi:phosphoribosylaminoimidazole carboxylase PurE protein
MTKRDERPVVGILMGSDSDLPVMEEASKILWEFDVPNELVISSAHRTPNETHRYAKTARERGLKILIAGAGHAAHLAGVLAANSILPVIGVPIDSSALKGLDALLATVQMPGAIPVATMAIGKAGARNAGLLAVEILALEDPTLQEKLIEYRQGLADKVRAENKQLQNR